MIDKNSIRQRAIENGLRATTVYRRIYDLKWSVEKALSTPARHGSKYDVAAENGILPSTARARVLAQGWSYDDAIKVPKKVVYYQYDGNQYTISDLAKLSPVGISKARLSHRLNIGWSIQRALTQPLKTRSYKTVVTVNDSVPVCETCSRDLVMRVVRNTIVLKCPDNHMTIPLSEDGIKSLVFRAS